MPYNIAMGIYKEDFKYLSSACLNVTDACNLACRYCFVQQEPHFMTYDIAQKAVEYLMNNYNYKRKHNLLRSPNEVVYVNYFGGEPTLMWEEIIVPLTTWAIENYGTRNIRFGMTTNGTLLDEGRINFMKKYEIHPLLSFDGNRETQEYNRPCRNENQNSFDLIMTNVPKILEAFPDTSFRGTLYQPTIHNMFDNYVFAKELRFKDVSFILNCREEWSDEHIETLKREIKKTFDFIERQFKIEQPFPKFKQFDTAMRAIAQYDLNLINNENWHIPQIRECIRCGLATEEGSIGYDGSIYGCQEQTSRLSTNDPFYLGNVLEGGIDPKKQEALIKEYCKPTLATCSDNSYCEHCKISSICKEQSCPSWSYDTYGDFQTNNRVNCIMQEYCFEIAVPIMERLTKSGNKMFKDFLFNQCGFVDFIDPTDEMIVFKPENGIGTYFGPLRKREESDIPQICGNCNQCYNMKK